MAISTKQSGEAALAVLSNLGVNSLCISAALAHKLTLSYDMDGVVLEVDSGSKKIQIGHISMKSQVLSLLKADALGPASKKALAYQFEGVLTPLTLKGTESVTSKEVASKVVNKLHINDTIPAVVEAEPVKLSKAMYLYQPVLGTTANSIYTFLASFNNMRVAVRRPSNGNLSVRVEWVDDEIKAEDIEKLNSLGLSVKGEYASAHYKTHGDLALMEKTFGAVLGALGLGSLMEVGNIASVGVS